MRYIIVGRFFLHQEASKMRAPNGLTVAAQTYAILLPQFQGRLEGYRGLE